MRERIMPDDLIIRDAHAAYAMRYHNQPPADFKQQVIERMGGRCACCGESHPELMTLDHHPALAIIGRRRQTRLWLKVWRAGERPPHLQLLCQLCNHHKGDRSECAFKIVARHVTHLMKQAA